MRTIWIRGALLALLALSLTGAARPGPSLLGIELGMSDLQVRRKLAKLGEPSQGAETAKQTWKLRHPRYGYVVVRYDRDWKVRWATAFARPEGRRLRYSEVGPLGEARRVGYYIYVWDVPPASRPGYRIMARGSDSLYASSVALSAYLPGAPAPLAAADSLE